MTDAPAPPPADEPRPKMPAWVRDAPLDEWVRPPGPPQPIGSGPSPWDVDLAGVDPRGWRAAGIDAWTAERAARLGAEARRRNGAG